MIKLFPLLSYHDGKERFEIRSETINVKKHSTLSDYQHEIPETVFNSLFKFTIVRTPWDRLISYYFSPHRGKVEWNRRKFVEFIDTFSPIEHYTHIGTNQSTDPFNTIDFYIRFENLQSDFSELCREIGITDQISSK